MVATTIKSRVGAFLARLRKPLSIILTFGLICALIGSLSVAQRLEEDVGLGWLFKLRGVHEPPSEVVVVAVDKASADRFNIKHEPGSWPRSLHQQLIDKLTALGVKAIVFDVLFKNHRSPEQDQALAQSIARSGRVILAETLKKEVVGDDGQDGSTPELLVEKVIQPIPEFSRAAVAQAPFPLPRVPIKVSQFWTFSPDAGDVPTLPVVAFQLYTLELYPELLRLLNDVLPGLSPKLVEGKETILQEKGLVDAMTELRHVFVVNPGLRDRLLTALDQPTASNEPQEKRLLRSLANLYGGAGSQYLYFYGPARTVKTIPYYQLLESKDDAPGVQNIPDLKDKVIFVGSSEKHQWEQIDGFYTVYSNQESGLDISGVEIAATAFSNLLRDDSVHPQVIAANFFILLAWGVFLGLLCYLFSASVSIAAVVISSFSYLFFAVYQFSVTGIWLPVVVPLLVMAPLILLAGIFWKYLATRVEQRKIRRVFGYYLPEKEIDRLINERVHLTGSAQLKYGVCLATDAEQYSALSEKMSPEKLSTFMNRYYEVIFAPVRTHGGFVSDVVGDSMLAIWASTSRDIDQNQQACYTAIEIQRAVENFNNNSEHKLHTRIGLHCGDMMLGNVGALNHFEYRAVGDMVNTASRIEGLNKALGTRLLVSEQTLAGVDDLVTRKLGSFILAGKTRPITIHEILCRQTGCQENQLRICNDFNNALSAFYRREWDKSARYFRDILVHYATDGPSRFYLALCERYREAAPDESWDGSLVMGK